MRRFAPWGNGRTRERRDSVELLLTTRRDGGTGLGLAIPPGDPVELEDGLDAALEALE